MYNCSALKLLANQPDLEAQIGVDFLVRSYGESWNPATYQWYLKREFHGEAPDRLVLVADRQLLATAGIAYRQLLTPDGTMHRVGIMVAACVPPRERGRGRFVRLWKGAVEYCATRDCTALLGFVTADNASCVILRRARAVQIPSWYVISNYSPLGSTAATPHFADLVAEAAEVSLSAWPDFAQAALQPQHSNAVCRFYYPSTNAWRSQFIDRPYPVQLLRVGDTGRAIIERVGDTDRLQWLDGHPEEQGAAVAAIVARARRARRRFFMYSTAKPEESDLRKDCGLKARSGFIMAMATRPEHEARVRSWATLPWWVQSGDRL
jgi:hypothetical protein